MVDPKLAHFPVAFAKAKEWILSLEQGAEFLLDPEAHLVPRAQWWTGVFPIIPESPDVPKE